MVRASEKQYRLLADNVKEVIWTLDLKTLRISYITPSVFLMMGSTPQEAKSQFSFKRMLTPESAKKALDALKMGIVPDEESRELLEERAPLALECYTRNGDTIWTETTFTFLRDGQNQAFEMLGVSRDITERRRSEMERNKLESQLIQSNKLEAIGTLAGGISHDMNNILTAIMGYVEISLSDVQAASRVHQRLEIEGVAGSIEALERFRQFPDRFDMVITDQTMPGMTGCDLAKKIWEIRPAMPVILCSGFNDLVNPESARLLGISEYVMKPYSKHEISMKIRRGLKFMGR